MPLNVLNVKFPEGKHVSTSMNLVERAAPGVYFRLAKQAAVIVNLPRMQLPDNALQNICNEHEGNFKAYLK